MRLLGEVDRGLHGLHRGVVALGFRHHGQRLLGLLHRAGDGVALCEPGKCRDVGRIVLEHLGIDLRRGRGIALGEHGLGLLQDLCDVDLARRGHALGQLFDEGVDLALRHRAHESVGRLAIDEGDHGRDRLDAHLARDRRMLVDVHLDQLDLALGGLDRLFQHGGQLLAGAAPLGPEVDQHRLALRFLDDVLYEGLGGGVLDQIGRGRARRSVTLVDDRHGIPRLMSGMAAL